MSDNCLPIDIQTHRSTQHDSLRNRVASRLANLALGVASPEYRKFVAGAILYGMNAAARDAVEGNEPPRSWWTR